MTRVLTLHYFPDNASQAPHFLLNEIGVPFELALVDRALGAQRSAEYLRLNPTGRIPTLVDGDLVVYETAAIVLYLVERFPGAGLGPPLGSKERAHLLRWVAHLASTVQPEMLPYFYPERYVTDPSLVGDVKRTAERRLEDLFDRIDQLLGAGPYLLGDRYTAADPYLLMLMRGTRGMSRPPRALPNLARHADRLLGREAILRTLAAENVGPPFV
jgi:glutathione S-transferase